MSKSLNEKMKSLSAERQNAILHRASQLIAEVMTLKDLRLALEKTQADLAAGLHNGHALSRGLRRPDDSIQMI